ncbi:hypothetical protein [Aporhodopirellula aestuarii]|uniref:Uncharacterized protein n=1 Tax=Aporhodopirellula aestuarii TaxID=2950107 RepID=A0ABT0UB28_9BACT|nr:hypothetical protein [Aporhodopirellula aestuarii]MCM2374015.1 hypothetical protein [Aporhodopirellula aestuarii]
MTIKQFRAGLTFLILAVGAIASHADAGSPWVGPWPWSRYEGTPRVDVIGPVGNRLPESYRRQYNRPTYLGGKLAAKIEPSSQEAMAFHRAEELGLYDNNGIKGALAGKHCAPQRVEQHYFYPKPWEVLTVGPRRDRTRVTEAVEVDEPPMRWQDGDAIDQAAEAELEAELDLNTAEVLELPGPVLVAPVEESLELPAPVRETE